MFGRKTILLSAVGAVLGISSAPAPAATIPASGVNFNFNGSDQFTNNFTQVVAAGAAPAVNQFTYSGTVGVLDNGGAAGGGVAAPSAGYNSDGTTAYYNGGTADFTANSYTVSGFYLRLGGANGNRPLQLGFSNNNTKGFNGANSVDFFSVRVDANAVAGTTDALEFQVQPTAGGAGATQSLSKTNFAFIANHWYKISGTFSETSVAAGTFSLSGSIFDYGTDGVTVPALPVLTISNTFTDAALANASALNVGFRSNDATLAAQFDNFAVAVAAPEPASVGLLAMSALATLARRRRIAQASAR